MLGIGLGLTTNKTAAAASGYSAEATAYFAAMSVAPDATRKGHLNTLIAALKTAGVWAKLDALYIMAAHDAQAARVNAVNPASVATTSGTLTFTTDRGYAGNGTTGYMSTGFNPSTASNPKFTQNSAHMGAWSRTAGNSGAEVGTIIAAASPGSAAVSTNVFGNSRVYVNSGNSFEAVANSPATAHICWSRTGAATTPCYRNASLVVTSTLASVAPGNSEILLAAANSSTTGTITPVNYCSNQIMFVHWGSQLSGAEVTALYNALDTYKTAVGA